MKIGIFTNLYRELPLAEALKLYSELGITDVEIGAGGNPGNEHCDSKRLLSDENAFNEWVATVKKYHMNITALSVHGNPRQGGGKTRPRGLRKRRFACRKAWSEDRGNLLGLSRGNSRRNRSQLGNLLLADGLQRYT